MVLSWQQQQQHSLMRAPLHNRANTLWRGPRCAGQPNGGACGPLRPRR
jgi:hypothetical protein